MLTFSHLKNDFLNIRNFSLNGGEIAFISGVSGSGKSLFLRSIADIDVNESDIQLNDLKRSSMSGSQWRSKVSLLPAKSSWWGETVGDSLDCSKEDLLKLDLPPEILTQDFETISSGESQRLALLRILFNKPDVLLLDEPTANLDPDSALKVESLILSFIKNNDSSAIWISHDKTQVERVSALLPSRLYVIENGCWGDEI